MALASAAALAILLGACSPKADGPPPATPTTTTTPATSTTALDVPALSFTGPPTQVALGDGWSAGPCEGDAPLLCVTERGKPAGLVEMAVFPVESFQLPGFRQAIEAGDEQRALRIIAADFVTTFEADRKDGCGTDYELEASRVEDAMVLGKPGLRYGYVARRTSAGDVLERQVNHAVIDGDDVVFVNASGYSSDGCVPPEGEFTPADLERFTPYLRALVAVATR